jgi:nitroreductase
MDVTEAVVTRRSVRAFRLEAVPLSEVIDILQTAARAPSGSNLQPWKVYVVAGAARDELVERVKKQILEKPQGETPEHQIHPAPMPEPHQARFMRTSELLYGAIGLQREDMVGRAAHLRKNWEFYGAPVGLIFTIHREFQPSQWAHVGMYMQNVMLLAHDRGIDTCAQEAWALWPSVIREYLRIPTVELVYCGMAMGKGDPTAPINQFVSERADISEYVTIKQEA